jgi:hypothetical protein
VKRTIICPWATFFADDAQVVLFEPTGFWLPCGDITDGRATIDFASEIGTNIQIGAAVQVCNNVENPGSTTAVGLNLLSPDVQFPTDWTALSTAFQGAQFFRPGALVTRNSGTGLVMARAQITFEFKSC